MAHCYNEIFDFFIKDNQLNLNNPLIGIVSIFQNLQDPIFQIPWNFIHSTVMKFQSTFLVVT